MNLCGPMPIKSKEVNLMLLLLLLIIQDLHGFIFIRAKSDTLSKFIELHNLVTVSKNKCIKNIRSDHGREFDQANFHEFCIKHGITHNFLAPRTPQQNV